MHPVYSLLTEEKAEWLGNRVREVMDELGFSTRTLTEIMNPIYMKSHKRSFASHTTLGNILNRKANRLFKGSEIELMAECMGIKVDRLLQIDIANKLECIEKEVSKSKASKDRLLELEEMYKEVALGVTEKCWILLLSGRMCYVLSQYDDALSYCFQALEFAKSIKLDKNKFLYKIHELICLVYLGQKNYDALARSVKQAEIHLREEPSVQLARFLIVQANHFYAQSDYTTAIRLNFRAIKVYSRLSDRTLDVSDKNANMARVYGNLAEHRFRNGNYRSCIILLQEAARLAKLSDDIDTPFWVDKNIARAYLCIGEKDAARQLVEERLKQMRRMEIGNINVEVKAKYLLLSAYINTNPDLAMAVTKLDKASNECHKTAYKLLLQMQLKAESNCTALEFYNKICLYEGGSEFYKGEWF